MKKQRHVSTFILTARDYIQPSRYIPISRSNTIFYEIVKNFSILKNRIFKRLCVIILQYIIFRQLLFFFRHHVMLYSIAVPQCLTYPVSRLIAYSLIKQPASGLGICQLSKMRGNLSSLREFSLGTICTQVRHVLIIMHTKAGHNTKIT